VNNFIGINVSPEEQIKILERLEFTVEDGKIYVPSFRDDVVHKADISEEIARFYGFDKISTRPLSGTSTGGFNEAQQFENLINKKCIALGLSEVATYSFISPKAYDKICLPENSPYRNCIVISNPLGEDTSVMRTTALPSMLEVVSRNYNNRNLSESFYEIAKVYFSNGTEALPDEKKTVMIAEYGENKSFFTLKGKLEAILEICGVSDYDVEAVSTAASYHPGRTAKITVNEKELAIIGEIHPDVLENYGIGTKVWAAQIDFDYLYEIKNTIRLYKSLPKYPAITRDLAFVCDRSVPVLTLEKLIKNAVGTKLEKIELFDVYEGVQVGPFKKSVAFSLTLRAADRTLTDEEADAAVKKAIKALSDIGATLRA